MDAIPCRDGILFYPPLQKTPGMPGYECVEYDCLSPCLTVTPP